MNTEEYYPNSKENEGPNLRTILDSYLKYWKWFLGCIILSLCIAMTYLTLTKKTYLAISTIIIKDEEGKGNSVKDATGFSSLSMLSGISTSSIENELGLLRSKRLMNNAIKALNLNIKYFDGDGILKKEYYKNSPYIIRPVLLDETKLRIAKKKGTNEFSINFINEKEVKLNFEGDEDSVVNTIGNIIVINFAQFYIEVNPEYNVQDLKELNGISVEFELLESVASKFKSGLDVELVDENSTLIQLSVEDEVSEKAEDVLDQLVFEYNQEALEDKDLIARNTAFFIDERLAIINSELDSVETGKEQFKESNKLTDIQAESSLIIQNVSDYNNQQQQISTELELTSALINHLKNNSSNLLPTNLGIDDAGTNALIEEFNALVLERNRLLGSAGSQNPRILDLNEQIGQIRDNVMESLNRRKYNLRVTKNNLDRQSSVLASQISNVPAQERAYRDIERQQNIKEALYLFLLQKREENTLSLAAKAPKAKLVDKAYAIGPVSPNPKIVLTVALLAGLFLPFLGINIKYTLNDKLVNSEDVKKVIKNSPFYGELPHISRGESEVIAANGRSILAEAFNILAVNIQYFLDRKLLKKRSVCIFVTSSIKGEGKTFAAINIAVTLATGGKKVLVIGADLRNPQLHRYQANTKNLAGLSDYLNSSDTSLDRLIQATDLQPNLKFLYAGNIPQNPIELLKKPKVEQLFSEVENLFDYIIVDTAPVLQLADTSLISKYADLTLYILRASFTKKEFVNFAKETENSGRLKNVGFVLNDVDLKNTSYGNSYDYGS